MSRFLRDSHKMSRDTGNMMNISMTDRDNTLTPSALFIVGGFLTVLGCFLPWVGSGCAIYYITPGLSVHLPVSIDPWLRHVPVVFDHGGIAIILTSITLLSFVYSGYPRVHRVQLILSLSIALVVLPIYHIVSVLIQIIRWGGNPGEPQLLFGLPIVLVGTLITLVASVRFMQRR